MGVSLNKLLSHGNSNGSLSHGSGLCVELSNGSISSLSISSEEGVKELGEQAIKSARLLTLSDLPTFAGEHQVKALNTETPKTETPKTETPKTETPKTETPKTETDKVETRNCISLLFSKIWKCLVDAFKALGNLICCRTSKTDLLEGNRTPKVGSRVVYEKIQPNGMAVYEDEEGYDVPGPLKFFKENGFHVVRETKTSEPSSSQSQKKDEEVVVEEVTSSEEVE